MQGMSWSSLKRHPSLIPLFFCLGFGVSGSLCFSLRVALRNPDVSWHNKKNPEPWQDYADKQYKLYSPSGQPIESSQAPKY